MMGQTRVQNQLFYAFNLEDHVPPGRIPRGVDRFLDRHPPVRKGGSRPGAVLHRTALHTEFLRSVCPFTRILQSAPNNDSPLAAPLVAVHSDGGFIPQSSTARKFTAVLSHNAFPQKSVRRNPPAKAGGFFDGRS